MLRRWVSSAVARPAVTKPFHGTHFYTGDFVEVQTFDGELRLGQVIEDRPASFEEGNEAVRVRFLSNKSKLFIEDYPRQIRTAFIRFHRTPDSDTGDLIGFQAGSFQLLRESYDKFINELAVLRKEAKHGGQSALIYETDMARRVFGCKSPRADQLYATHIFLYGKVRDLVKDVGFRASPIYHLRSEKDLKILTDLDKVALSELDDFSAKLYSFAFPDEGKRDLELTLTEKDVFVPALIAFAGASYINASGPVENPFLKAVNRIVTGICQPVPGEVHRILSLAKLFPSDFDPVEKGSGCLQHEPSRFVSSFTNVPWDYENTIEDEVLAVDSAETVEVDDAIHFDGDWVHVHVADSSHFAPFNSPQDHLARNRVSTIYMPTKTIPMLPDQIVSMMSLTPERVENPALTFSAKIGEDGSILDYKIGTSVLKKIKRATYEEADKMIQTDKKLKGGLDLVEQHYQHRLKTGHIPFSIPKPNIKVNDESITFSIKSSSNESLSQKLVSESMLIAGRVAAMYAADHKLAVPFRYHPAPISPDPAIIERILKGESTRYDSLRLLMTMSPSAVDTMPRRHWSMGLDMYAKATSPIRRYFDLLLHHQVKASLVNSKPLGEMDVAKLLPATYRHEQYLKHLQKVSTRYWTLRHLHSILTSDPSDPRLTTSLLILESSSTSVRQKVWVESLALILYANVLGKVPTGIHAGTEVGMARIAAVDPLRSYIELVI